MAEIKTGLVNDQRFSGAVLDGYLHMTNGLDRPVVTDGATTWNMGIKKPTSAATYVNNTISGSLTAAGTYSYYYVYWNSVRNRHSAFSPVSADMTAGVANKGIRITIPANTSLETGVDYVKVYRNLNGGALYYYDGCKAYAGTQITYDSSIADTGLGEVMGELDSDGTTHLDINGLPPTCPYMAAKGGRLGMAGRSVFSSGTAEVTNGSSTVTLSVAPTTGMDGWRFRVDGDTEEYLITTIDTSAKTFELTDMLGTSRNYQGTTAATATYYLYTNGSIFYYSRKDSYGNVMPESFYAFDYYPVQTDDGDEIKGIGKVKNNWFIPKRNHLYMLAGDTPEEMRDVVIPSGGVGCISHWSITNDRHGNAIFVHDTGVYITDGYNVKSLSHQPDIGISIENIFTGKNSPPFSIIKSLLYLCHATYDPETDCVHIWVPTSDYMDTGGDSTICDKDLVYDFNKIDGKPIGWYWWDIPASCSEIIHDNNGNPEFWFTDEWGFAKKFDSTATNDGAGSDSNTRRGTATSGDTTSVIDSGATFYTTGSGLQGVFVHIIAGTNAGEIRRITTNTATDLTVTPAFSAAIDTTSVYAIGAINARRLTKVYDFGNLMEKIIRKIRMVFDIESSTYSAFFKHYENFSTTVKNIVYMKLNDTSGYYDCRFPSNRAIHHQYEYGLHDVDKPMTIREVEVDVDTKGTTKSRAKRTS